MAPATQDKIDIVVYGPSKPEISNGFPDTFVTHSFETLEELDKLSPDIAKRVRGMATTKHITVSPAIMGRFPKLEMIGSFGVGYDHIDFKHAAANNIMVTSTPDVLTEEVADVALGLLISTVREFGPAEQYLRSGDWSKGDFPLSRASLRDRTVGIVGMGRIGQAIARRIEASHVPLAYHSRNPAKDVKYKYYPNLKDMATAVDTLIIITPGGAATNKLINADILKALGPRGIVINVGRGSVVDDDALIAALKDGTIMAAGLDVFTNEPSVPAALIGMKNVVLLPHIASGSIATRGAMAQLVVDNIKAWFAGKPPITPIPETPYKGH